MMPLLMERFGDAHVDGDDHAGHIVDHDVDDDSDDVHEHDVADEG